MVFTEAKRYYVERRVWERMAATGSPSFTSYFNRLRTDTRDEIQQFVNAFTVNETYFYREDYQLRCLTNDLLTERLAAKPAAGGTGGRQRCSQAHCRMQRSRFASGVTGLLSRARTSA